MGIACLRHLVKAWGRGEARIGWSRLDLGEAPMSTKIHDSRLDSHLRSSRPSESSIFVDRHSFGLSTFVVSRVLLVRVFTLHTWLAFVVTYFENTVPSPIISRNCIPSLSNSPVSDQIPSFAICSSQSIHTQSSLLRFSLPFPTPPVRQPSRIQLPQTSCPQQHHSSLPETALAHPTPFHGIRGLSLNDKQAVYQVPTVTRTRFYGGCASASPPARKAQQHSLH